MEKETLFADLLEQVEGFITRQQYAKRVASAYRNAFVLLQTLVDLEQHYNRESARAALIKAKDLADFQVISQERLRYVRKILEYTETCFYGIPLKRRRVRNYNLPLLSFEFEDIIRDYECSRRENACYPITVNSEVRKFLLYVRGELNSDFSLVTPKLLTEYVGTIAERRKMSLQEGIDTLRHFVKYLILIGKISENCQHTLEIKVPRHKRIKLGFSNLEGDKLLSAVDRNTPIGKRDYAALLLGKYLGIRGVDVFSLKLTDIDYKAKTISFIQSKTKKPLILPLPIEVEDALCDYILNARPETEEQHIFVWVNPPYCKLGRWNGKTLVKKYANIAGLEWEPFERGYHSFRRGLGVALLDSGSPLAMVSEVLGHSSPESAKPYTPIDLKNLCDCPLSSVNFTDKGGEHA